MILGEHFESYIRPVTPATLSSSIISLCRELTSTLPIYIDVQPISGSAQNECFQIVDEVVRSQGGGRVLGWSIWEWPSLFVEAEFHAVLERQDGRLLDVTPKAHPTARILFLRDDAREYNGRQVNNVRRPVSKHSAVTAFVQAADAEFDLTNRGDRALQHGAIHLEGAEASEFAAIQSKKRASFDQLLALKPRIGPYDPCLCGSGQKVKWCHKTLIT